MYVLSSEKYIHKYGQNKSSTYQNCLLYMEQQDSSIILPTNYPEDM